MYILCPLQPFQWVLSHSFVLCRFGTPSEVFIFCGIPEGAQTLEFKNLNRFVYPELKKHLHQLDSILQLGPSLHVGFLCLENKRLQAVPSS